MTFPHRVADIRVTRSPHDGRNAYAYCTSDRSLNQLLTTARNLTATISEELNFLLTNRIPRRTLTQLAGWYSRIESPTLTKVSLAVWSFFGGDLHLEESESTEYRSVQDCFTRKLRAGVRPIDQDNEVLISPCDAILGAMGQIHGSTLVQAKGLSYSLQELLRDNSLASRHFGGTFVTLRLRSNMYHRFHAPGNATLKRVRFISGDTWNVNPIAVKRIERLFCRNERAVVEFELHEHALALTLVPVAAILVASIRVLEIPYPFNQQYNGSAVVECRSDLAKGQEVGYFENGSTIIALVSGDFEIDETVREGNVIRMGQPLFRRRQLSSFSTTTKPDHPAST